MNDFDLITHSFPDDISIFPIADVHLGAIEHAEGEWQSFINRLLASDSYVVLAGDLLNNSVRTAGFTNPYDEKIRPREAKRLMVEYLSPIRDRILLVTTGNHERRSLKDDDQDLTYDICSKLDIEHLYRENIAFMAVSVGTRNYNGKPNNTYTFAVTHGTGGGQTGASVNRNEKFSTAIDGLDCFISAHVHKGTITKPSKIVIDVQNHCVSVKSYVVVSCVSWLNYGGYAAQKMLLPAQVCDPQKLTLSSKRNDKRILTSW